MCARNKVRFCYDLCYVQTSLAYINLQNTYTACFNDLFLLLTSQYASVQIEPILITYALASGLTKWRWKRDRECTVYLLSLSEPHDVFGREIGLIL